MHSSFLHCSTSSWMRMKGTETENIFEKCNECRKCVKNISRNVKFTVDSKENDFTVGSQQCEASGSTEDESKQHGGRMLICKGQCYSTLIIMIFKKRYIQMLFLFELLSWTYPHTHRAHSFEFHCIWSSFLLISFIAINAQRKITHFLLRLSIQNNAQQLFIQWDVADFLLSIILSRIHLHLFRIAFCCIAQTLQ